MEAPVQPAPRRLPPTPALAAAALLVLGVLAAGAHSGLLELLGGRAGNSAYNLLARGLAAGRLDLARAVPPGLAALPDPYDPAANHPYRYAPYVLHDLSYRHGRLYLYFGITPALLGFAPWAALTGGYLWHRQAALLFWGAGFLASLGLLRGIWQREFPSVPAGVGAAGALALGLASGGPILLQRAEVYEVAIACGYALVMLALGGVWLALRRPEQRTRWTALAALALGLAAGARPTLALAAAALLVPLWAGRRERLGRLLLAAGLPLLLCGLGLAWYNAARFGDPLDFGQKYQLATYRQDLPGHFRLAYLPYNLRLYFLRLPAWRASFPFVAAPPVPPAPAGHGPVEDPFGILACVPFAALALAAPLAWRASVARDGAPLRGFAGAVLLLLAASAAPLLLYYWDCSRYEMEFLPELVLLAVIGVFGLERMLAGRSAALWAARAGWGLLLAYSIAFNLLAGLERHAEERVQYGGALVEQRRFPEAIAEFRGALAIRPSYPDALSALGAALAATGRLPEAVAALEDAVRGDPALPGGHTNLANALAQSGRAADALVQYEEVCRLQPESAQAHYNLAYGLQLLGRRDEARAQYQEALRLNPDLARPAR